MIWQQLEVIYRLRIKQSTSIKTFTRITKDDRNKDRYKKVIVLFLLSIFMLLLCQSKTSFIMAVFAILFLLFENTIFNKLDMNTIKYITICISIFISLALT